MNIDAFNLVPGSVINIDGDAFVIKSVIRFADEDAISLFGWLADRAHGETFDYSDQVDLIGLAVNYELPGDQNIGTRTPYAASFDGDADGTAYALACDIAANVGIDLTSHSLPAADQAFIDNMFAVAKSSPAYADRIFRTISPGTPDPDKIA